MASPRVGYGRAPVAPGSVTPARTTIAPGVYQGKQQILADALMQSRSAAQQGPQDIGAQVGQALNTIGTSYMAGANERAGQAERTAANDTAKAALAAALRGEPLDAGAIDAIGSEWVDPGYQQVIGTLLAQQMKPGDVDLVQAVGPDGQLTWVPKSQAAGMQSALPKGPEAAPTRERGDRGMIIQEEMQPDGTWRQIGSKPQFAPQQGPVTWSDITDANGNIIGQRSSAGQVNYFSDGPGSSSGPFEGTGMDAQSTNIVLQGDPMSPKYAAAYNQLAQPKVTIDPVTQQMTTVSPDMSWAPKPGQPRSSVQPIGTPTPAPPQQEGITTANVPGAVVTSTPGDQGARVTGEQLNALKAKNLALDNLESAIGNYEAALQKYGSVEAFGAGRGILESAYSDLLIQQKEAAALGALTGPDMQIMNQQIVPPNSLGQMLAGGSAGITPQLSEARKRITQRRDNLNKNYAPRSPNTGSQTTPTASNIPPPPPGFVPLQ